MRDAHRRVRLQLTAQALPRDRPHRAEDGRRQDRRWRRLGNRIRQRYGRRHGNGTRPVMGVSQLGARSRRTDKSRVLRSRSKRYDDQNLGQTESSSSTYASGTRPTQRLAAHGGGCRPTCIISLSTISVATDDWRSCPPPHCCPVYGRRHFGDHVHRQRLPDGERAVAVAHRPRGHDGALPAARDGQARARQTYHGVLLKRPRWAASCAAEAKLPKPSIGVG